MPSQANINQLEKIKGAFDGMSAMWLVDYRGLTVKQVEALRRLLRESGSEMKVYKNNLMRIALKDLDEPSMDEYLEGPNGFVFATGDIAASAKVLKDFAKDNNALEIKSGLVDGQVMGPEKVMAIADLPSREELLAKLLGTINNPTTKLVRTLNEIPASFVRTLGAIADQKSAA